jgi:hypothetical protein
MERVVGCNKELGDKPTLTTQMELRRTIGGMEKESFQIGPAADPSLPKGRKGLKLPERALAHLAPENGVVAEFLFDTEELIVFRHAIGAAERTRLDLACIRSDRDVGDGDVFGFA